MGCNAAAVRAVVELLLSGLEPDRSAMNATRLRVTINAPRSVVYRALIDPAAVAMWRVPDGMRSTIHEWDAREGGSLRVSLTYDEPTDRGKTTARTDTYRGHFIELVPDERVVEVDEFETSVPELQGAMRSTIVLSDAAGGGTDLVAVHDDLPRGVSASDNETGWRMALGRLAALVEKQ